MNTENDLSTASVRDLKDVVTAVEKRLATLGNEAKSQHSLYEPLEYILSLGGKRIRPAMAMLAYQAVSGKDANDAVDLGVAVEMFHNFTLVHDDIMDNAPVRRGKSAVHVEWDVNTAILAGDALFAWSVELLINGFPEHAADLVRVYSQVSLGVCEGQMDDMAFAGESDVTIADYLEMIRKKTAVLLGGCLELGVIAAGGDKELQAKFRQLGEAAGIGFQLQDDYLDAYGDAADFGKQVGGDIIEGKRTFLLLKAYELLGEKGKGRLDEWMEGEKNPAEKVKNVLAIFDELGIRDLTKARIEEYFNQANEISDGLADLPAFGPVKVLLDAILRRKF